MISNLNYLPVAILVCMIGCVSTTFYLSVYHYNHVTYILPYISDTGTYPPESCIFGFLLSMVSILIFGAMFIKYIYVEEIYKKHHIDKTYDINKMALSIGFLTALGISIVANFQETNLFTVHWIGAFITFGAGSIYISLQTYLYMKISPVVGQRKITIFRIILSFVSCLTFLIFISTAIVAYNLFSGDITKWHEDEGGYKVHLISTNTEWLCAASLILYIVLYYWEFKSISLELPKIHIEESYFPSEY